MADGIEEHDVTPSHVKRHLLNGPAHKYRLLSKRVRDSQLIKHVRVSASHVCNNNSGTRYQLHNMRQKIAINELFVTARASQVKTFAGIFYRSVRGAFVIGKGRQIQKLNRFRALSPGFQEPAFSRYGATAPRLLAWFKTLNAGRDFAEQVKPFNFTYGLQAKGPT